MASVQQSSETAKAPSSGKAGWARDKLLDAARRTSVARGDDEKTTIQIDTATSDGEATVSCSVPQGAWRDLATLRADIHQITACFAHAANHVHVQPGSAAGPDAVAKGVDIKPEVKRCVDMLRSATVESVEKLERDGDQPAELYSQLRLNMHALMAFSQRAVLTTDWVAKEIFLKFVDSATTYAMVVQKFTPPLQAS
ncbi:unnamed protein product [Prorocentrum cordatum]|uniref:Uncharacterized protein n=1 Tax=Prorocentrum cordatum TaxID=2364126 RepID=A0ABN9V1X2_9DINO|nr:unnamed protein product [Polarella glacialis]